MVRVFGSIRSQATEQIEVEGDDVDAAKAAIRAQLPPDAEVIEYRSQSKGSGPVHLCATIRSTLSVPHEAEGDDYASAYAQYKATIPAGWISLGVGRDDSAPR